MADTDQSVSDHIEALVAEEHRLLDAEASGPTNVERARLEQIRLELDQLWDLLRQRRALREFGSDPNLASERDGHTVENYRP
jgi:Protein of unknown function (DUF2630)